jgi:uncharacterized protein YprB with RNaseH-like and TPR domain
MYQIEELKINVKNIFINSPNEVALFEILVINEPNFEYDVIYNDKLKKQKVLNLFI